MRIDPLEVFIDCCSQSDGGLIDCIPEPLSFLDKTEHAVFDNISGSGDGLLPYTPHTTGPAGMFYMNRFNELLRNEAQVEKDNE